MCTPIIYTRLNIVFSANLNNFMDAVGQSPSRGYIWVNFSPTIPIVHLGQASQNAKKKLTLQSYYKWLKNKGISECKKKITLQS